MKGEEVLDFLERIKRYKTPTYQILEKEGIYTPLLNMVKVDMEYEKITPTALKRRSPELFKQLHNILVENRMKDLC